MYFCYMEQVKIMGTEIKEIADIYQKLYEAEFDLINGDVIDGEELFYLLKQKYLKK